MAPDPGRVTCAKSDRVAVAMAVKKLKTFRVCVNLQDVNPETRIGAGNMRRLIV